MGSYYDIRALFSDYINSQTIHNALHIIYLTNITSSGNVKYYLLAYLLLYLLYSKEYCNLNKLNISKTEQIDMVRSVKCRKEKYSY